MFEFFFSSLESPYSGPESHFIHSITSLDEDQLCKLLLMMIPFICCTISCIPHCCFCSIFHHLSQFEKHNLFIMLKCQIVQLVCVTNEHYHLQATFDTFDNSCYLFHKMQKSFCHLSCISTFLIKKDMLKTLLIFFNLRIHPQKRS